MTKQELIKIVDEVENPTLIVTVVLLPTGAKEVIVNHEFINEKIEYILKAYDDGLNLLTCPNIKLLGLILL
jgi:hypothetical protein